MPVTVVFNNLSAFRQAVVADTQGALESSGTALMDAIKASLHAEKHGAVGSDGHRASAPGEAPASKSGELEDSLFTQTLPDGSVAVSSSSDHAVVMEMGSGGGTVAARPFMSPAAYSHGDELTKEVAKGVQRAAARTTR